jgi:hypothetical protein
VTFSDQVLARWLTVSACGLAICIASWVGGESVLSHLQRTGHWLVTSTRVTAAAVSGFGMGGTFLFIMTLTAGLLYWILRRLQSRKAT